MNGGLRREGRRREGGREGFAKQPRGRRGGERREEEACVHVTEKRWTHMLIRHLLGLLLCIN